MQAFQLALLDALQVTLAGIEVHGEEDGPSTLARQGVEPGAFGLGALDGGQPRLAEELDRALHVLSTFDEGPDLVLYYKYLLVLNGDEEYRLHFNEGDRLSPSQQAYVEEQYRLFQSWWAQWPGARD